MDFGIFNLMGYRSRGVATHTLYDGAIAQVKAAEAAGFNIIGKLSDAVPYFQTNVIAMRRSWAEKNRPTAVRFMRAMLQ